MTSSPPATPALRRVFARGRQGRPRLWTELALIVIGYGLYSVTRDAVPGQKAVAIRRAESVLRIEHRLHFDIELSVNHALDKVTPLIVGMNYYYATLHFVITIGVLVWLYVRHPQVYRAARTVLFLATVSSLIGFYFFALAPPRFLTGHGFINTVVTHHTWGSWGTSERRLGLQPVRRHAQRPHRLVRLVRRSCSTATPDSAGSGSRACSTRCSPSPSSSATANHFVLDAVGGALNLGPAFGIRTPRPGCGAAERSQEPRYRRRAHNTTVAGMRGHSANSAASVMRKPLSSNGTASAEEMRTPRRRNCRTLRRVPRRDPLQMRQHQQSVGGGDPAQLGQRRRRLLPVVRAGRTRHDAEGAVGEGQRGGVGAHEDAALPRPGHRLGLRQHPGREVHADQVRVRERGRRRAQQPAGAAADVQDPTRRVRRPGRERQDPAMQARVEHVLQRAGLVDPAPKRRNARIHGYTLHAPRTACKGSS